MVWRHRGHGEGLGGAARATLISRNTSDEAIFLTTYRFPVAGICSGSSADRSRKSVQKAAVKGFAPIIEARPCLGQMIAWATALDWREPPEPLRRLRRPSDPRNSHARVAVACQLT